MVASLDPSCGLSGYSLLGAKRIPVTDRPPGHRSAADFRIATAYVRPMPEKLLAQGTEHFLNFLLEPLVRVRLACDHRVPLEDMLKKLKIVRGWVWPGSAFLLLAVLLATFAADAAWLAAATPLYPLVVYVTGFVLAWRFRRSRVAAIVLGLFMMDLLLRPSGSAFQPGAGSIWDASGVLFLFFMPVVAAGKDRGVPSRRGLI